LTTALVFGLTLPPAGFHVTFTEGIVIVRLYVPAAPGVFVSSRV